MAGRFEFLNKKISEATLSDIASTVTLLYVTKTLFKAAAIIIFKTKEVTITKEA